MELVFVRHALPVRVDGPTDALGSAGRKATRDRPIAGPADPGLADAGRRQARRVAQWLAGQDPRAIYASPQRRARETAEPLAAAVSLPVAIEAGLAEFDPDATSYVPVEELRAAGDPRWDRMARGELYAPDVDPTEFRRRVVAAVEVIVEAHPGERVVLFSHAGAINAYTGHVLDQSRSIWFAPAYCSLTRVAAARDGRRGIVSLNETGHVRDLLP